ncbi:MAG: hypothetical protein H8E57_11235 [Candidatus Cloacimonetes bacterium]|nr:hypothetical protein [Candidatus Cloacimonadota bacterium]
MKITKIKREVPIWRNKKIKSYSEINRTSEEQINFYNYLKENFLKGKYIDLEGNDNYAFILYYNLLEDYLAHRDWKLLDRQLKALEWYYKLKNNILVEMIRFKKRRDESYTFGSDLGMQFKDKLRLKEQEIEWLNRVYEQNNVFISIDGCRVAVIKQYFLVLKELNKKLKNKDTSIAKETTYLKEETKKFYEDKDDPYWGYYNIRYLDIRAEH